MNILTMPPKEAEDFFLANYQNKEFFEFVCDGRFPLHAPGFSTVYKTKGSSVWIVLMCWEDGHKSVVNFSLSEIRLLN